MEKNISGKKFTPLNLFEFSLLLGTDYGTFKLQKEFADTYELLKYYMINGVEKLIYPEDMEKFFIIKKYYEKIDFDPTHNFILKKPSWTKPKLLELKKRLLELNVDEDYIDRNNELFDCYYNKYYRKTINSHKKFCFNPHLSHSQYSENNYGQVHPNHPNYPNPLNL